MLTDDFSKLTPHYKIGTIDWYVYRRMLMPVPAPHIKISPEIKTIKKIVFKKNLIGAVWTYDWDCNPSQWYWIICDNKNYNLKNLNTNDRRDIRRGLARTEVRPCTLEWIAEHGYPVYQKAFRRYRYTESKDYRGFCKDLFKLSDVAESQGWCVFHKDKLIAWLSIYLKNNAVFADDLKFDPDYRSSYPTNAVFYTITTHYLIENNYDYITAGARNVHHQTMVQDFLIRCMGWRKAYARLGLWLRPEIRLPLSLGIGKLSKLFYSLTPLVNLSRNLESANLLWEISHA